MKLKVDLVAHLASNTSFSRTTAAFCLLELVEKVADVKNGAGAKEAISCIAEACSLEFTSHKVRLLIGKDVSSKCSEIIHST